MESLPVAEERQQQLIEAAVRVLSRDGLAATTTRKIAAEAGVNISTLHYYFGSKDDLLVAVIEAVIDGITGTLQDIQTDRGLRIAMETSISAFWAHVMATPELQIMQYELVMYAVRDPQIAWLAKKQYEGYCEVAESVVRKTCEDSQVTIALASQELARFMVAGLDGLILQYLADRDPARAERNLKTLIDAIVGLAEGSHVPRHNL